MDLILVPHAPRAGFQPGWRFGDGEMLDRLWAGTYIFSSLDRVMSRNERVRVTVSGVVQGVGFRYFVARAAAHKSITGWVRNLPDGNVEVVGEGNAGMLREFVSELHAGPHAAHVAGVTVHTEPYLAEYQRFEVRS